MGVDKNPSEGGRQGQGTRQHSLGLFIYTPKVFMGVISFGKVTYFLVIIRHTA